MKFFFLTWNNGIGSLLPFLDGIGTRVSMNDETERNCQKDWEEAPMEMSWRCGQGLRQLGLGRAETG